MGVLKLTGKVGLSVNWLLRNLDGAVAGEVTQPGDLLWLDSAIVFISCQLSAEAPISQLDTVDQTSEPQVCRCVIRPSAIDLVPEVALVDTLLIQLLHQLGAVVGDPNRSFDRMTIAHEPTIA